MGLEQCAHPLQIQRLVWGPNVSGGWLRSLTFPGRTPMSLWIIIYLGLFGVLSVGGLWDDYRDRRPTWFLACAVASNLTVVYLFVAFWQPSLRSPLGLAAPVAFIASMCWEIFQAVEDIRGLRADPELSETQQRVIATITAIALPVICLPAFIVAGISAFRV
jgi:hypothetical protein